MYWVYNLGVTMFLDFFGGDLRWYKRKNLEYSPAVVGDIVSRIKRANRILEFNLDDAYQFYLEHEEAYKVLSVSVRSQIKKAVRLYRAYMKKDEVNKWE